MLTDASALVAILSNRDQYHSQAMQTLLALPNFHDLRKHHSSWTVETHATSTHGRTRATTPPNRNKPPTKSRTLTHQPPKA